MIGKYAKIIPMLEKLKFLYGEAKGLTTFKELQKIIAAKKRINSEAREAWNEKDVFLITYADSFSNKKFPALKTLHKFLSEVHLTGVLEGLHILPFYPYSSDRGFSISDFDQVKNEFGSWDDIQKIAQDHRLIADLVLNHVSVKHRWFQGFLAGDSKYEKYFISFEESKVPWEDLKKVVRSRATPLVTPFETVKGKRYVWTTYSVGDFTDQVDLNYKNPEVLLEMIKVFLNLLEKGVRVFRMDAISSIWKELGTTCRNLPQTHTIIKLFRQILDELCPSALMITEVNTSSFTENLKYFGNGKDEAQIFYNFPLASILLQSFYTGNSDKLNEMVSKSPELKKTNTLFNVLDIHDGYNTHLAREYLTEQEFTEVFKKVEKKGGKFSYRIGPDGKKIVKEMNITWWSAVCDEGEPFELQLKKFITSRAIAMAIKGIPAIYYLSLFGIRNDLAGYEKSKHARDINRTNLDYDSLIAKLSDETTREAKIFNSIITLIKRRTEIKAFHPNNPQQVLKLDARIFALIRGEADDRVLALHNISHDKVDIKYENKSFVLEPYSFIWEKI